MKFYYPVIVKQENDGRYHAVFPDLTMCEAYGDTMDDCLGAATEAAYDCIVQIYILPNTTADNLIFAPNLYADGAKVFLGIGGDRIQLQNAFDYIDIDCDTQDCYCGASNANPYVILQNNDFPVLEPGVTGINVGTGIEKVEISPRWYIL